MAQLVIRSRRVTVQSSIYNLVYWYMTEYQVLLNGREIYKTPNAKLDAKGWKQKKINPKSIKLTEWLSQLDDDIASDVYLKQFIIKTFITKEDK